MDRFDPRRSDTLPHAGTFKNNVLTIAAGVAACDIYLTPENLDALYLRGEAFRAQLAALFRKANAPYCVTGVGSLMNIHGVARSRADESALRRLLQFEMMEQGIYFAVRGLIALSLPISADDIVHFLDVLTDFLHRHVVWLDRISTLSSECRPAF